MSSPTSGILNMDILKLSMDVLKWNMAIEYPEMKYGQPCIDWNMDFLKSILKLEISYEYCEINDMKWG